jgi:hypothetical protein
MMTNKGSWKSPLMPQGGGNDWTKKEPSLHNHEHCTIYPFN